MEKWQKDFIKWWRWKDPTVTEEQMDAFERQAHAKISSLSDSNVSDWRLFFESLVCHLRYSHLLTPGFTFETADQLEWALNWLSDNFPGYASKEVQERTQRARVVESFTPANPREPQMKAFFGIRRFKRGNEWHHHTYTAWWLSVNWCPRKVYMRWFWPLDYLRWSRETEIAFWEYLRKSINRGRTFGEQLVLGN